MKWHFWLVGQPPSQFNGAPPPCPVGGVSMPGVSSHATKASAAVQPNETSQLLLRTIRLCYQQRDTVCKACYEAM